MDFGLPMYPIDIVLQNGAGLPAVKYRFNHFRLNHLGFNNLGLNNLVFTTVTNTNPCIQPPSYSNAL